MTDTNADQTPRASEGRLGLLAAIIGGLGDRIGDLAVPLPGTKVAR